MSYDNFADSEYPSKTCAKAEKALYALPFPPPSQSKSPLLGLTYFAAWKLSTKRASSLNCSRITGFPMFMHACCSRCPPKLVCPPPLLLFTKLSLQSISRASSSSSSLRFNNGRYLHARSTDKSAAALNSKTAYHAKAGHLLAQHTPLTVKVFPALHHLSEPDLFHIHILHQDFVDGSFGDSFFSKQNVSSENEAKKMRTDVQALACNACVLTACIIVPSC
jgi:hypothetical protein